jgi:hypothetical protein
MRNIVATFLTIACASCGSPSTTTEASEQVAGTGEALNTWSGWSLVPVGGTTDAAYAVATFDSKLYLFGKGIGDGQVYVATFDGSSWTGWSVFRARPTVTSG